MNNPLPDIKTRKEFAARYGVSEKCFVGWIKPYMEELKLKPYERFKPWQVKIILDHLE